MSNAAMLAAIRNKKQEVIDDDNETPAETKAYMDKVKAKKETDEKMDSFARNNTKQSEVDSAADTAIYAGTIRGIERNLRNRK